MTLVKNIGDMTGWRSRDYEMVGDTQRTPSTKLPSDRCTAGKYVQEKLEGFPTTTNFWWILELPAAVTGC